ncbi:MAG: hypothetical protein IPM36_24780 [Lewinellaceae bacterium]|nr:hypothetical protein [Lewinellaceae bacterium]
MKSLAGRLPKEDAMESLREQVAQIDSRMTAVEQTLYQTKTCSSQDPLNYPVRLNDKPSVI